MSVLGTATFGGRDYTYEYIHDDGVLEFLENTPKLNKAIGIDIETYAKARYNGDADAGLIPLKSKIRTLQVYDGAACYILDFMGIDGEYLLLDPTIVRCLQHFLLAHTLVAHNALFETLHLQNVFLAHHGTCIPLNIRCTMNMYRLVAAAKIPYSKKLPATLASVCSDVLGYDMPKENQRSDWSVVALSESQLQYCCIDAVAPLLAIQGMLEAIAKYGMADVFMLNTRAQEALVMMKLYGATVDQPEHQRQWSEWQEQRRLYQLECLQLLNDHIANKPLNEVYDHLVAKVTKRFQAEMLSIIQLHIKDTNDIVKFNELQASLVAQEAVEEDVKGRRRALRRVIKNIKDLLVNPDSGKQLSSWLKANVSKEDLMEWPLTDSGKDLKTDADAFSEHAHIEAVVPIGKYKKYAKLDSTYGVGLSKFFVPLDDGRVVVYPNYSLCFTDTGRMSSFAPNLQNQPRDDDFRNIWVATDADHKLLCADFSQIELRIAAYMSGDATMIAAYDNGLDLHTLTASAMARVPVKDVTKEQRQSAKACFSGDTEVLTEQGWISFAKYKKGTPIAQYITDVAPNTHKATEYSGAIEFVKPLAFKYYHDRELVAYSDRNVSIQCTPDHEILYLGGREHVKKKAAATIKDVMYYIGAGRLDSNPTLSVVDSAFLAMCVGRGHLKAQGPNKVKLRFKNLKKISRAHKTLKAANVAYTCEVGADGYTVFRFEGASLICEYAPDGKTLSWDTWQDIHPLAYLWESQYWNGGRYTSSKESVRSTSTNLQTLEIMQTMATTSNMPARIRPLGAYSLNGILRYELWYKTTAPKLRAKRTNRYLPMKGKHTVYCAQVPSGNILIRHNKKVVVTGNCNFGLLYGAGAATLKSYAKKTYGVEMSQDEAETHVDTFRDTYPAYREWQLQQAKQASRSLEVTTPVGKVRRLDEDNTYCVSMNTPVQGGAAEVMLEAMINITTALYASDYDAYLCNVVHDEMIINCHVDDVGAIKILIKASMECALLKIFPQATTRDLIEVGCGNTWTEAK